MIRLLLRHAYSIAFGGLTLAILLVGGFIVTVALPDLQRPAAGGQVGAGPAAPSPSPSPGFMAWLSMPNDADCSGCHLTSEGAIGLRQVPPMGHPLEGWNNCTACHAPDRLVDTAPGHRGIHASACLTCHQPGTLPAPLSRPHRESQNTNCLDCHGSVAPLPADMTHRTETVCWLCHRLPAAPPPVPKHQVEAGQTNCTTCHNASRLGALPADHAQRTPTECVLCHAPAGTVPPVSLRRGGGTS
ncbi:MAG TPA: hypothetical protein VIV06_05895 [Candidatus Limnocylindrales bacterium]